jgi:hypothetical protein
MCFVCRNTPLTELLRLLNPVTRLDDFGYCLPDFTGMLLGSLLEFILALSKISDFLTFYKQLLWFN